MSVCGYPMTASCQYRRPVPDWSSREAGVTGDQVHSRSVPGFDSPDRLTERRFQNAFADGPEYKAKYPSLQILAVADDDQINDGCAVRLSRESVGVARQSSPHVGVGRGENDAVGIGPVVVQTFPDSARALGDISVRTVLVMNLEVFISAVPKAVPTWRYRNRLSL